MRTQQIRAGFWGIDLTLTAVAVFFLVKAIHHLFVFPTSAPEPLADSPPKKVIGIHSKVGPYEQYASLRTSNLFGALSLSNVAAQQVIEEKLPETTLELELLGAVSAHDPQLSFAVIRDKRSRTEDTYGVGDFIVGDAKVEEIRENEVVISRAGRREVLAMLFSEASPFRGGPPPGFGGRRPVYPSPSRTSRDSVSTVRVVNENLRYIDRGKLTAEVGGSLSQLLDQFRTSPNIVDNKPTGVRIDQLGSHPLIGQAGIRPGDVVKSINGIRINSLNDIFEQSDRLKNAPEVRVVVERGGRHRTLVYKIR